MVPIQKKGRSKGGHKDKVLDMALGSAPKSAGKKPCNRKKSNSQKPPVTETRDLLEGNRSVFVNPQAPVFPLNVAPVPILPVIQQQTENNRLNSLFPEAAPHQPVIQNVSPFPNSPFPHSPFSHSPFRVLKIAGFSLCHVFDREDDLFACIQSTSTKTKFTTRILLVFYSYVLVCTCVLLVCYSYVLVWCFSHDPLL
jgi:hypothetical protein